MNPFDKIKTNQAKTFIEEATGENSMKTQKKLGRPKNNDETNTKKHFIAVYVSKEDKNKLKELAQKRRMSISQYLIFKAFEGVEF